MEYLLISLTFFLVMIMSFYVGVVVERMAWNKLIGLGIINKPQARG